WLRRQTFAAVRGTMSGAVRPEAPWARICRPHGAEAAVFPRPWPFLEALPRLAFLPPSLPFSRPPRALCGTRLSEPDRGPSSQAYLRPSGPRLSAARVPEAVPQAGSSERRGARGRAERGQQELLPARG